MTVPFGAMLESLEKKFDTEKSIWQCWRPFAVVCLREFKRDRNATILENIFSKWNEIMQKYILII